MNMVKSFEEIQTAEALESSGGKGRVLAGLHQKGFPVPDGFVVLPAAFSGEELLPAAWEQTREQLAHMRRDSGTVAFAVRSSAMAEDSTGASFAGEFKTVLDVRTDQAVWDAIHAVRGSARNQRVHAYTTAKGIETQVDIAIVIQRMVAARISGVLFTVDPVTGSRTAMVGNYTHGTGDRLVSGETSGEAFRIMVPKGTYEGPGELEPHARRLFELAHGLERELGGAQDIEWSIGPDGKLFLLQSRPVTTLIGFNPAKGDWNASVTGDYVWSNVNFGEAVTDAMTPLSWTVLRHVLRDWIFLPGHPTVGSIGGRPYLNISVFATAFHAVGKSEQDLLKSLEGTLFMRLPASMSIPLIALSRRERLAAIPRLMKIIVRQTASVRKFSRYVADNPVFFRRMQERIQSAKTGAELHDLWRDEIDPHIRRSAWIVLGTATYSSDYTVRARRELTELSSPENADALLSWSSDSAEEGPEAELLDSLGPLVNIARVARGDMDREEYLRQYGHRGPHEFELSVSRPAEDPSWLESQLARYRQSPVDVDAMLAQRRNDYDAAWEQIQAEHPRKAKSIQRHISEVRKRAKMREAARSEYVRDRWLVRVFAVRAGQLTDLGTISSF